MSVSIFIAHEMPLILLCLLTYPRRHEFFASFVINILTPLIRNSAFLFITLKHSASAELITNLCIQNFTPLLVPNLFPSRWRNIKEKGGLKLYKAPLLLSFEGKGFWISLPGIPQVSKGWLKSQ